MGSDWEGRFDHLGSLCAVIYLPRTEGVSSTDLKQTIYATARRKA
jgi:glycerol-3-phosphate cytidylyltransferase